MRNNDAVNIRVMYQKPGCVMKTIDLSCLSALFDMVYAHLTRSDRIRGPSHAIRHGYRLQNRQVQHIRVGLGTQARVEPWPTPSVSYLECAVTEGPSAIV